MSSLIEVKEKNIVNDLTNDSASLYPSALR